MWQVLDLCLNLFDSTMVAQDSVVPNKRSIANPLSLIDTVLVCFHEYFINLNESKAQSSTRELFFREYGQISLVDEKVRGIKRHLLRHFSDSLQNYFAALDESAGSSATSFIGSSRLSYYSRGARVHAYFTGLIGL